MIEYHDNYFILNTAHTTYAFCVLPSGHLEHLHYGRKIHLHDTAALAQKSVFAPCNTVLYQESMPHFSLEDIPLEFSSYGKGDVREPFLEIVHADGGRTSNFIYEKHEIIRGKPQSTLLPNACGNPDEADTLLLRLYDPGYSLHLTIGYHVFPATDIITRTAVLSNDSAQTVRVHRLLSGFLELPQNEYETLSFHGAWGCEMQETHTRLNGGKFVLSSHLGTSGSRTNPLFFVCPPQTTQDFGDVYGCNLIYSGDHYACIESDRFRTTRVAWGLSPDGLCYTLSPGETFEAPEAVMTFSCNGLNGASQNFHHFVNQHIIRGEWKGKTRPVLLNSWEAAYYDFYEAKLLRLATEAANIGIELFVLDDGWFGERNDEAHSLGDWKENTKKLPRGLRGLANQIKALGMQFGIWVEPEMVNENSRLYQTHPEWTLAIPDKPHSMGRHQYFLDLTSKKVQDYLIGQMEKVFSSADISYVKWDMNRIFSDYYAPSLPPEQQGEVSYRYYVGLYRVIRELTQRFPHILFEGCAAGGNRFDLGMLCYFPQIWASENTDAVSRLSIQNGYSYGYPQSTLSCHVSGCPNHQTLRTTPLMSRFHVASFGILGYECNLCDLKKEEKEMMKTQIAFYKEKRSLLQFGDFYRGRNGCLYEWTIVSPDKKEAAGLVMQLLSCVGNPHETYFAKGLSKDVLYHFTSRPFTQSVKDLGDLINTVTPFHIRQNSLLHNAIAKFIKLETETEDYKIYGDALMYCGVRLKQAFCGTGFHTEIRMFKDFSSRMYLMEAVDRNTPSLEADMK